ncbi:TonB-dependent siderophore receptor [Rouxiella badensis]|uniref:TonB-dependent siderophore receptor n=4 Tax=Rahnella TaxID=34037 RepID=A0ABS6KVI0_9GAMM|nr:MULTISPECIES: TonB-dependent siderophore receptor [Yersiniaceae]MBU9809663.1 TonB-dependent siderophore receptor [Rahnella perminowiae]MBU9833527.1 TonB-dependent siderophore receptor [Rahnella perminowiae]MBU9860205.1 TonB-dependent siderophore receptor [Rahnella aceris]MCC3705234.1 TonB-dependent siderophore receptor [Rouxiella badensis]MCC3735717.1 TonB-dependent siderophore receptor [Rouxiella badensis]
MNAALQSAWKTHFAPGRLALHITFALANTALLPSQAAYASPAKLLHYSVPAGSLEQGLLAIARQSQQTISFNPKLVAPYQAKPISGNFTLEQVILHQLQGTPLFITTTANGTLTISALATPAAATSELQAAKDSGQTLPTITVNGGADQSEDATVYNPSTSSSVTRTNLALQDTAQSVQVVSRKLIEDRQAVSVEDALRNTGGVTIQGGDRGLNTIYIRGFSVDSGSTDGVSNPDSTVNGSTTGYSNIDGIERVEVLKGPQAVLAGNSSPAGSVNVVRKAPTSDPLHTIKFETSKYGEVKTAIDLGGPLNDDKTFRYRLNASTMHADNSFPDFNGKRNDYLAPVLAWVTDKTKIKVGAEFSSGRTSGPAATVYTDGHIQRLPVYRLGDKDDHFSGSAKTFYYELNQDLSDNWSFNSKATYLSSTTNYRIHETYGASPDGSLVTSELANKQDLNSLSLQNDIRGKIDMGPITHNLLLGYDYQHAKTTSWDLDDARIFTTGNFNDPDSLSFPSIPDPTFKSYTTTQDQKGLILQDQIDLWKKLHFQLSAKRAEWTSQTIVNYSNNSHQTTNSNETKWVPSYGVSYDITPEVAIYANLLNSFATSGTINTLTGKPLAPSTGKSKEVGFKFNLLDDNLTITTAMFHIVQSNVAVTNIAGDAVGTEGRDTKGFDLDVNGQIFPGWNITTSYTFAQPKDPDTSDLTGYKTEVTGQPKHSGSIWSTYELQSGQLRGLGAGVGVEAASSTMNGTTGNYFKMGGWAQTDASIFYHQPKYTVTLGVKNIFNRDLYYYSTTATYIGVKPGRTARLSLTYTF